MEIASVLLVDEHVLVRAGIRALLEKGDLAKVVGEAQDGFEALDLIESLRPSLVFIELSGLDGLEILKEMHAQFPWVHVVVLTMGHDGHYAFEALQAGAVGYLPKRAAISELGAAINSVTNGGRYLSSAIELKDEVVLGSVELAGLTPRQREVLRMIAEGYGTKGIARELDISVKTVETHRAHLMERLDIHDIASLVRYSIKTGLVSLEAPAPAKRSQLARRKREYVQVLSLKLN